MRATLRITVIAIAAWLSSCVGTPTVISVPDPVAASRVITPEDARVVLKGAKGQLCSSILYCDTQNVVLGIDLTDDQVLVFVLGNGRPSQTLPVHSLKIRERLISKKEGWVYFNDDLFLINMPPDLVREVADALAVIQNSPSLKEQKEQKAAFEIQAKSYPDAAVKPIPGENVRRDRVQAEATVKQKRVQAAANLYAKALRIAPWWPEGQFDMAFILGDLRQYDKAIDHMTKYLALVPNAADARDAQDKIYAWEGEKAAR
jgi:hypothetical protein